MEYVRYFCPWGRPQPQDRPLALETSHLGKLPNELLRTIAEDYLEPVDRASFSLTCTQVLASLGTKHLATISTMDDEFYQSLRLQAKDSANLVACWRCRKLHSINTTLWDLRLWGWYLKRRTSILICWFPISEQTVVKVYPGFNSALARMALKLHQQGKNCDKLVRCLSQAPVIGIDRKAGRLIPNLFAADTRLVNDSLIVRKQGILLLGVSRPLYGAGLNMLPWSLAWWPCTHVIRSWEYGYTWFNTFKPFTHILERKFDTRHETKTDLKKQKRSQCQLCKTEFRIDVETLDGFPVETVAIHFTIWQELADEPTEFAIGARSQQPENVGKARSFASDVRHKFDKDGPFVQFEDGADFDAASLWRKGDRRRMMRLATAAWC